jgi:hypothetical protein
VPAARNNLAGSSRPNRKSGSSLNGKSKKRQSILAKPVSLGKDGNRLKRRSTASNHLQMDTRAR